MKGVLLTGGRGTRLNDNTRVVNKHLIRVFDKPMIEYPLHSLLDAGIHDIMVITGKEHSGTVFNYLGSGSRYNAKFTFRIQDEAGGIAEALLLAEEFVGDDNCFVLLGDNIFSYEYADTFGFTPFAKEFDGGAFLFLKNVPDPHRFGVAEVVDGKVASLEEKPKEPKSNYAVTGAYMFDNTVFDKIRECEYSARGELEITDVNKLYLKENRLKGMVLDCFWSDAGTIESITNCDKFFYERSMR